MICGFKYSRKDTLKVNIKIQGYPQRMRLKRGFQDLINQGILKNRQFGRL